MAIFVLLWPFNQFIYLNLHVKIEKLIQTETETVKRLEIFSAQLSSARNRNELGIVQNENIQTRRSVILLCLGSTKAALSFGKLAAISKNINYKSVGQTVPKLWIFLI